MTTDIYAIIAAAKRFERADAALVCDVPESGVALMLLSAHSIAMAEALARIAEFAEQGGMCEPDHPSREAEIARDCLDKIVKEANRG